MNDLLRGVWEAYRDERLMLWGGLAGLVLSGGVFLVILVQGPVIPPEGDLMKAATFNGAVGIYILTIALVVRVAGLSRVMRTVWRWTAVVFFAYGYCTETVQVMRGIDPRFTRVGTEADQIFGLIFFLTALAVTANFFILAVPFFTGRADPDHPVVVTSIRYGILATAFAFAGGFMMVAVQGRVYGSGGNLLPIHAAGFHGLQAVPLVALLSQRSGWPESERRRLVHLAGVTWLGLCGAILWQTLLGRPMLDLGWASILAGTLLIAWAAVMVRSVRGGQAV